MAGFLQREGGGGLSGVLVQRHAGNTRRCRVQCDRTDLILVLLFVFQVWIQHINGTQHADGQLNLLQQ